MIIDIRYRHATIDEETMSLSHCYIGSEPSEAALYSSSCRDQLDLVLTERGNSKLTKVAVIGSPACNPWGRGRLCCTAATATTGFDRVALFFQSITQFMLFVLK